MARRLVLVFLLLSFSVSLSARKPTLTWRTGTLLTVEIKQGTRIIQDVGSVRNDRTFYEIDGGDFVYVAVRTLYSQRDHQLRVTTRSPIKFAIAGDDIFLMDEDGKEHKLSLEEKRAKTPQ